MKFGKANGEILFHGLEVDDMADTRVTLEKQIKMLEKVQQEALKNGDMKKVEEIAISIVSISNTLNGMR